MDLTSIFGKFAGQEVPMKATQKEMKIGAKTISIEELHLVDEKHPVLEELRQTAQENGLHLRLWWPGIIGTMESRSDRLNVHIEKANDGKWRVSNGFNIG